MKTTLKILGYIAIICFVLVAIAAIVIYSGSYNVAAATRHTQLVHASLERLMIIKHGVEASAGNQAGAASG